jgi:hypothetical protein
MDHEIGNSEQKELHPYGKRSEGTCGGDEGKWVAAGLW